MPQAAGTQAGVYLHGFQDLQRAFRHGDRQLRNMARREWRGVAEPVKRDADALARSEISHIGEKWPQMRVGVTQKLVYVAPKQRGVRARGLDPRKRPNLAPLLMEKAMEPALKRNETEIVHGVERVLDRLADDFNHGGARL